MAAGYLALVELLSSSFGVARYDRPFLGRGLGWGLLGGVVRSL
jgi:hypothetical protein